MHESCTGTEVHNDRSCLLFTGSDVLYRGFLNAQVFINSDSAVANRRLRQKTDFHNRLYRKVEIPHHIEIVSIQRVMEGKIIPHSANLQPCSIALQIASA